jgi:signal transduction histidine kinase
MSSHPRPANDAGRFLPALIILSTLLVFALALVLISLNLRRQIRDQVIQRDGAVLNAVALLQQYAEDQGLEDENLVENPLDELALILQTSRLRPARLVRIYDALGQFITAIPASATEAPLDPRDLDKLTNGIPVHRYHARAQLADYLLTAVTPAGSATVTVPLLEVLVPIPPGKPARLVGAAQFILEGETLAQELRALDRHLWAHASVVFLAGGSLVASILGWAFHRLRQAHRQLATQTTRLARAHQELTLASKMSAIGTMTAHLMHELKSPLTGLRNLVEARTRFPNEDTAVDWEDVMVATKRMHTLVNDIVRVLNEESQTIRYEVGLEETLDILMTRVKPTALSAQVAVELETHRAGGSVLINRQADLILLVLEHLLKNAIQATPPGHRVGLAVARSATAIEFVVSDQGPGLPEHIRHRLFSPCRSTKPGGSGIGLALCKQLADQLGAEVSLKHSSAQGTVFILKVPLGGDDERA